MDKECDIQKASPESQPATLLPDSAPCAVATLFMSFKVQLHPFEMLGPQKTANLCKAMAKGMT